MATPVEPYDTSHDASHLLSAAGTLLEDLLSGLQKTLETSDLDPALEQLSQYKRWAYEVDQLRPLRPDLQLCRLLAEFKPELDGVIAAVLDAFVSGIEQAQANGIKLQAHIDAATLATAQFTQLRDELDTINMDSPLSITKSALDLELRRSGLSLVDYVADTEHEYAELLGNDHIDEIALDAAMVRCIGAIALDPANFVTTLQSATRLFDNPPALRQIVAKSTHFLPDFTEARIALALNTWGTGKALEVALSERHAHDTLVGLLSSIIDRSGGFAAWALLLAAGQKTSSYDNLRKENETAGIKRTQQDPVLKDMTSHLNLSIRTAHAHSGIRFVNGSITATSNQYGTDTYAVEEVLNDILGAVESLLAIFLALKLALHRAGFTTNDNLIHEAMGIPAGRTEVLGLSIATEHEITTSIDGGTLHVKAVGSYRPQLLSTFARSLLTVFPEANHIVLTHYDATTCRVLEGPAEDLRCWQPGAFNADIRMLEILTRFTLDGEPALPRPALRAMCARIAIDATSQGKKEPGSYRSYGQTLRHLIKLGQMTSDQELEDMARGCLRFLRTKAQNDELLATLRSWSQHRHEEFP